jgi:hypothetical protein
MIHELKCIQPFFDDVITEIKTFEVRKIDRDFQVGDLLALNEYTDKGYTGRCALFEITYILCNSDFCKLTDDNHIMGILGIRPVETSARLYELMSKTRQVPSK